MALEEDSMKLRSAVAVGALGAVISGILLPNVSAAQKLPLAPARDAGQTVIPAFEGWHKNRDGTFSLSFGYHNRNEREVIEILRHY